MVKFDHMSLPVREVAASRDWYVANLGFKVEFEDAERKIAAIQDDAGFTIFLQQTDGRLADARCALTLQVEDVDAKHRELAQRGIKFVNAPQRLFWGYGAELHDPDGYLVMLWDEVSMCEKGGA